VNEAWVLPVSARAATRAPAQAEPDERACGDDDRDSHAASSPATGRPACRAQPNASSIATGSRPAAARNYAAIEAR
jgi:hypothetical protein